MPSRGVYDIILYYRPCDDLRGGRMEEFVEEFFDQFDFPVMVTDQSDYVVYKNPFAKKYLPAPRKGGSIVRYVNSGEVNVLDDGGLVALQSVYGESSPYRRAVVVKSDDSYMPKARLWVFDPLLPLLRREHIRGFLAGLSGSLAPVLIPLIKDDSGIKYLPRAADAGEPLRMLCRHFYSSAGELEAAASFNSLCPADHLVEYLKRALIGPTEKFGCPVVFRYERGLSAAKLIDFTRYAMIFIRLFTAALEKSVDRSVDILIRCDDLEFSTLISYNPRLPKRYSPSGRFPEFRTLAPGDDLNSAMLEALFEGDPSCKFSFSVGPEKTFAVTARFDMPLVPLPWRLEQKVFDENDPAVKEAERMISDYIAAILEK